MVKMGSLIKEERGIPHFGCTDHRLEKTEQRFYTHAGVEKSDVDGGMGQGGGGAGGGAGRLTVKTFGGGKKAKVGLFTVPGVQDASVMARKVNIYENVYPSVLKPVS